MDIGQELAIYNVSLHYGSFLALDNVTIKCGKGQFTTILGSSGSGKTTLLKAIAGFEKISSGKIFINGKDVALKKAYERNIGMLFQNYALFPHLSVADNIAYPLRVRGNSKSEIKKKVENMLDLVKLSNLSSRYPKQLSGGQQQRIALARALVYEPSLLLLDEPLGALDMSLRHDMQFEIKRITRELGITTVSVTHDQEEAFAMSDLICIMASGKVQQFDTPKAIYESPANTFVATFMGTTNVIQANLLESRMYGNKRRILATCPLCTNPILLDDPKDASKNLLKGTPLAFAVRPENLHLNRGEQKLDNCFEAKLSECIYLGQMVKAHALSGQQTLNVNLTIKEFNSLDLNHNVYFGFDSADTALLLS